MAEYIDREEVRNALYDADAITMEGVRILNQFPAADVVEVVRCKDCKYWKRSSSLGGRTLCTYHYNASYVRKQDDYCSKGEPREEP